MSPGCPPDVYRSIRETVCALALRHSRRRAPPAPAAARAGFLLPGWLADFRRQRPDIHPQLEIVNSLGVIDAVRENRSEIGFVDGPDAPDDIQTLSVARDEIVVVVAAEHPWARRRTIAARDLITEPYLTREAA